MTYQLTPGRPADPADMRASRELIRILAAELPRVREAATAWRNSLGGLLVALAGFSLIKGRSDVGELKASWGAAVGFLLLAALIAGAAGALLLTRAASGRPSAIPARALRSRSVADHAEAMNAAAALRGGIIMTLGCAALLVAAVAVTWYGPGRAGPVLQITTPSATVCGSAVSASHDRLALQTAAGLVTEDLAAASAVQAVASCAASTPLGGEHAKAGILHVEKPGARRRPAP